jgi:hypothetical protein
MADLVLYPTCQPLRSNPGCASAQREFENWGYKPDVDGSFPVEAIDAAAFHRHNILALGSGSVAVKQKISEITYRSGVNESRSALLTKVAVLVSVTWFVSSHSSRWGFAGTYQLRIWPFDVDRLRSSVVHVSHQ